MKWQFRWHILAIILLCICLPLGLCDKNSHRNDHTVANQRRTNKYRSQAGIPLRDDNDYIQENERNEQHPSTVDDDYDDEYDDESVANVGSNKKPNVNDELDVHESPEIVEQAQSARTQIIQRPKELTAVELAALLKSSPTPLNVDSADAEAPSSIETCPKECSCLNDFMTCTPPHLKHLPKVPHFIQILYVIHFSLFLSSSSYFFYSHLILIHVHIYIYTIHSSFSSFLFNCFTALFLSLLLPLLFVVFLFPFLVFVSI